MTDAVLSLVGIEAESTSTTGDERSTPNVTVIPTYGLFACADGRWLSLGIVHEDHFWQRLCDVAGLMELAGSYVRAASRTGKGDQDSSRDDLRQTSGVRLGTGTDEG